MTFRWVKGHATEADVKAGKVRAADKQGNDGADTLAVEGSALHEVDPRQKESARRRVEVARAVQRMMLHITWERAVINKKEKTAAAGRRCGGSRAIRG